MDDAIAGSIEWEADRFRSAGNYFVELKENELFLQLNNWIENMEWMQDVKNE